MKRMFLIVAMLLGSLATISAQLPAQNPTHLEDVIYLNDGSVLRGIIVEQVPAVTYVIATVDGEHTIDALSIKKITKEPARTSAISEVYVYNPYMPHTYDEDGNLITPLSPSGAFIASLVIPGLGQMNNNQSLKGSLLFTGTLVGILGMTVGTNMVSSGYEDLVGYTSATLAVGCYLYSLLDAPIYAHKWNKKYGFKNGAYNQMSVSPAIGISGRRHPAMGLNVAVGF